MLAAEAGSTPSESVQNLCSTPSAGRHKAKKKGSCMQIMPHASCIKSMRAPLAGRQKKTPEGKIQLQRQIPRILAIA